MPIERPAKRGGLLKLLVAAIEDPGTKDVVTLVKGGGHKKNAEARRSRLRAKEKHHLPEALHDNAAFMHGVRVAVSNH